MRPLRTQFSSAVRRVLKQRRLLLLHEHNAPGWDLFFRQLRQRGIEIATVFDIGVASGTPPLYAGCPRAKLYLFDPTDESLPHMRAVASKREAEIFSIALGDHSGTVDIYVPPQHSGATIFPGRTGAEAARAKTVRMERFDDVVSEFATPALCKLDVQGAELMVLNGMPRSLPSIDYVILEASLAGSPDFDTMHAFMIAQGFVLYDIAGMLRRPFDNSLAQFDPVYVRADSPLRVSKPWSKGAACDSVMGE